MRLLNRARTHADGAIILAEKEFESYRLTHNSVSDIMGRFLYSRGRGGTRKEAYENALGEIQAEAQRRSANVAVIVDVKRTHPWYNPFFTWLSIMPVEYEYVLTAKFYHINEEIYPEFTAYPTVDGILIRPPRR